MPFLKGSWQDGKNDLRQEACTWLRTEPWNSEIWCVTRFLQGYQNADLSAELLANVLQNIRHSHRPFALSPFRPFRSTRKSFIPLISNTESGTVLPRCVSVIAVMSNLHNSCKHLSSSILFLKLQTFKWATLKSFAGKLCRCWVRSARWLSPSSPLWIALSVLRPSCPSSIDR